MYKMPDGSQRFCKATTHTSCRGCRFYEPTTQATFIACYEEIERSRELINIINKYIDNINYARKTLLNAAKCSAFIEDVANKMCADGFAMECLWIDSINTYE